MASEVFIDSGAWIAISDRGDRHHQAAIAAYRRLLQESRVLVTTNLVVGEAYVLIRRAAGHTAAMHFLRSLRQSGRLLALNPGADVAVQAEEILDRYADQDFSFVDAVSFATMRQRNILEAFAFDRDFLIAGFILIPTPS